MGNWDRRRARQRRHQRIKKKLMGTVACPRLNVFRSARHIYAQIIDDTGGHTLVAASTLDPKVRGELDGLTKTERASVVGKVLAERARHKSIKQVVFDRGGYAYHGRVQALAEASREGGLEF